MFLTGLVKHNYKPSNRVRNYPSVGKSQLQNSRQISNTFGILGGVQSRRKSVKLKISPYAFYITHNLYGVGIILNDFL
jgi:hypothetical protein